MKKVLFAIFFTAFTLLLYKDAFNYPPAVGILGKSKNCVNCHINNGPWSDEEKTIIEILDKETGTSLRQADGSFLVEVKRGTQKTLLTVIGRQKDSASPVPYRNAWLYIDPSQIESTSLSKFAPGWDVNLPMSCRLVGDNLPGYENANITVLAMTIQPLDDAKDAELQLQVMLTKGESIKGNPKTGMEGNYYERKVKLAVIE
ncbi:MAG: hypothetical protein L0Y79_04990 [Chlorobi bacterium]|nr:hypothetical protein [Chlorobiota bacterium]MCI0717156.1 hypothetical protein [Chlorobiota bacterium]